MTPTLRRWRWPLGIAAALALYALAGFFLAPWLLAREIPELARSILRREAAVARVDVNPFALSLRLEGLEIRDRDGRRLAGLDELRVNLEAESLLRRAWTFSEIRVVGPYLGVVRDRTGEINLLKLMPPAAEAPRPDAAPTRLILRRLRIEKGTVDLTDEVPATVFRTRIGPFDVAVDELSTLPDATGRQEIAITLESGTRIGISGDLVVNPLRATGQFSLHGPALGTVARYVRDQLRFTVADGRSDITARFALAGKPDGSLEASLSDLDVAITGLKLTAPEAPDFLSWSALKLGGGNLRWPAGEVTVKSLALEGLKAVAHRAADGTIDVAALLTPRAAAAASERPAAPAATGSPWKVSVGELALRDVAVELTDAGPSQPATWAISDLDLVLRDVSSAAGARFPLDASIVLGSGGTLRLAGSLGALPDVVLDADVRAEGIRLAQVQPYVSGIAHVEVRDGLLGLDGHIASGPGETLAYDGDVTVRNLDTQDSLRNQQLLAWRELGLDDVEFRLDANRARVSRVRLARPFARLFINRDQTTNVGELMVKSPPAAAPRPEAATDPGKAPPPFRARVGRVVITDGEVDFTDLSLPLPFAARVQDLKGDLTTIDTGSTAPSKIALEGRVDPYGLARVGGQVRFSAPTDLADVSVIFRNIDMAPLSPYTVKFAGRKIARGKIDLDLRYQLDQRRMVGANKIVIDELELGEKVPNPEAVDLPLGLAVALLKDANGRIDLDMPVAGSLDDPEFRIGGVLWKAFVNLVTKVVTAPFRLLGGLLGVESEDLGRIDFSPGRADLLPPEKEKLGRVAEAMVKRPNLALEVPAVVDAQADAAVLRAARVDARIQQELAATGAPESGRKLEKRTRQLVESLYAARFPEQPLAQVQARHTAPPPDEPQGKPRLDELAYLDDLRAGLSAVEEVGDADLAALAEARATAIDGELRTAGQVDPARVRRVGRKDVSLRDGQWVSAELGLSN